MRGDEPPEVVLTQRRPVTYVRSVVAYYSMTALEAEALVGPGLVLWPIDTAKELVALYLHLHSNWEVRVVYVVGPEGGKDNGAYTRIRTWWDGMDNIQVPLSKRDYSAVSDWIRLDLAQDVILPGGPRLGPLLATFRAELDACEDLYGPRTT